MLCWCKLECRLHCTSDHVLKYMDSIPSSICIRFIYCLADKINVRRTKPVAEYVENTSNTVLKKQLCLRQTSSHFKMPVATLCRYLKKHREYRNEDVELVFTKEQEEELLKYVTICAKVHYGLSTIALR